MKVKEESEKAGLKLNIQKTKIMASSSITSQQIYGETMETVTDFIFLGSKITADTDCSHEIKRHLLLGRKAMANLDSILKNRDMGLQLGIREWTFPCMGCDSVRMAEAPPRSALHLSYPLGSGRGHHLQAIEMQNFPQMSLPLYRISATQRQIGWQKRTVISFSSESAHIDWLRKFSRKRFLPKEAARCELSWQWLLWIWLPQMATGQIIFQNRK